MIYNTRLGLQKLQNRILTWRDVAMAFHPTCRVLVALSQPLTQPSRSNSRSSPVPLHLEWLPRGTCALCSFARSVTAVFSSKSEGPLVAAQCFDVRQAPPVFEEFALVGAALFIRLVEHHRCARVAHALFAIFVITASALSVSFRDATRATFHL